MSIGSIYTLSEAKRLTGEDPNLITFLIRERQIPTTPVGRAKVLDDRGLELLRQAIAEFHAKVGTAAPTAKKRQRKPAATS